MFSARQCWETNDRIVGKHLPWVVLVPASDAIVCVRVCGWHGGSMSGVWIPVWVGVTRVRLVSPLC